MAFVVGREFDKPIYAAIRKYGLDQFKFEVLEKCKQEQLGIKEIEYIEQLNSYAKGYNATLGGDIGGFDRREEKHPNHKLTKQDVVDIRTRYANKERKSEVYAIYEPKIGSSGFDKVWQGKTWKDIMAEVYTQENAKYHMQATSNPGSRNGRSKLLEQDVYDIRLRKSQGETSSNVYKDYTKLITKGSFNNIWSYQNWSHVTV